MEKYNNMWQLFMEFLLDMDFVIGLPGLCHYVEYLYMKGLKHSTIRVHLSAIAHGLKIRNIPDYTKAYIILVMIKGAKKLTETKDNRLPMTIDHLNYLIHFVQTRVQDAYVRSLYSAMYSWAYHACLRISEYTKGPSDHNLLIQNLTKIDIGGYEAFRIRFESFKHSPDLFPDFVIHPTFDPISCPVMLMKQYLLVRPDMYGPIFVDNFGGISRNTFSNNLAKCISIMGWDPKRYQSHSFRIGRATDWASMGYSAVQIKQKGRWFSDAFLNYIRPTVVDI